MRFFTVFTTFGLVAFAAAQNTTQTDTSSTSAISSTPSLSPEVRCLQQCGSADVCCQAKCVNVPCPSQVQANATTLCEAQCPQGNGTAAETQAFADCQAACVKSYFLSSSTAAGSATGSSNSAASTATTTTTTGSGASASSGGASPTASGSSNGANELHVGSVGLGFLALVVAGLAL